MNELSRSHPKEEGSFKRIFLGYQPQLRLSITIALWLTFITLNVQKEESNVSR